jgi:hypothetical protein
MFKRYTLIIIGAVIFVGCFFFGTHYYLIVTDTNKFLTVCSVIGMFVGAGLAIYGWVMPDKEEVVHNRGC